jgi:hypothetical protein
MNGAPRILPIRDFDLSRYFTAVQTAGLTSGDVAHRLLGNGQPQAAEIYFYGPQASFNAVTFSIIYDGLR